MWPHRGQPTRLRCPWNSPGKNTGVGCPFLLQCVKVKSCPTLSSPMDCSPPGSSIHGIFRAGILEWVASAFSSIDTRVNLNLESQVLVTLLASQYTFYRHGPYLLSWFHRGPFSAISLQVFAFFALAFCTGVFCPIFTWLAPPVFLSLPLSALFLN